MKHSVTADRLAAARKRMLKQRLGEWLEGGLDRMEDGKPKEYDVVQIRALLAAFDNPNTANAVIRRFIVQAEAKGKGKYAKFLAKEVRPPT